MSTPQPAAADARPRRRSPTLWSLLALVAGVAIWFGFTRPWETKQVAVEVETVHARPTQRVLAVNGRIAPVMKVDVSSTIGGRLRSVLVREGDVLKTGDLVAVLDDEQQKAAVAQADAAVDSARATLQQAKVEFERAQTLGDTISRRNLETAQLAVQTAQNDVERLSAARDQAVSLLAQYSIRAPFDGTVLVRAGDPGQVVSTSSVLISMADFNQLRAEAVVDELYSSELRRGLKARLQPTGYNRTLEGEISFVSPNVETTTGGRLVRVAIADMQGLALPIGLSVNLNILVSQEPAAITVPRSAIVDLMTAPAVFVIARGRAIRRPIDFVDWPSSRLIVRSGLTDGDAVIIDPKTLVDGLAVTVKGS